MRATQRGKSTGALRFAALSALFLLLFIAGTGAEPYVASFWDLGMGARPLAMGGAFVGLADDENALFFNPAGLAWSDGFSFLSSVEVRPYTAAYGHVSACFRNLGVGIHYFDFGEVPETDAFGNVIGAFSYRDYGLIVGTGVTAADLPYISDMPLAGSVAFGLSVKLLVVDSTEPGDGTGFAMDFPFLLRLDDPAFGQPYLTRFAFGVLLQNVLGVPITYGSGHREEWVKKVAIGSSVEVANQVIASLEVTSTETVHIGFEWSPVSALALRCGLKRDGVWMWSLGLGARFGRFIFDYALVVHPYLNNQHRGSLALDW